MYGSIHDNPSTRRRLTNVEHVSEDRVVEPRKFHDTRSRLMWDDRIYDSPATWRIVEEPDGGLSIIARRLVDRYLIGLSIWCLFTVVLITSFAFWFLGPTTAATAGPLSTLSASAFVAILGCIRAQTIQREQNRGSDIFHVDPHGIATLARDKVAIPQDADVSIELVIDYSPWYFDPVGPHYQCGEFVVDNVAKRELKRGWLFDRDSRRFAEVNLLVEQDGQTTVHGLLGEQNCNLSKKAAGKISRLTGWPIRRERAPLWRRFGTTSDA